MGQKEKTKTGYKDTLNLPKTDFPMKASLPQREPEMLKRWEKEDIYRRILKKRKDTGKTFILHDGPPYANGHIHMGHVLNKILKDICVKYYTMRGHYAPFVPGWDCHGLPVEHALFKELKINKGDIGQVEFRKKAYKYAMKFVKIQAEEFKRLGIFADWDDPYLTLTKGYEADILATLAKLYEKGYIYKGKKPVNWCASCGTALAEAEVEYEDKTSPSIFVKFPVPSEGGKTFFIIWTTTPWTLLANVAVALHPDFEYTFAEVGDEKWILASDLAKPLLEKFGIKDYKMSDTFTGSVLAQRIKTARHPFLDRDSRVVTADYVTKIEGTGCVHTAPGHGQEDYITGKKFDLPMIMPVGPDGKFTDEAGEFSGQHVYKANPKIVEKMRSGGTLVFTEDVKHSYPHCWRCKSPIIFRATEQWFMSVDHEDLRARMEETIKKDVEWIPSSGTERIGAMVQTRPDWCLSRQRYWGVPIPAFRCISCGEAFTTADVISKVSELTREHGADVWFERDVDEVLPEGAACEKCGKKDFEKEDDILDVWFDSGVSHQAVLERREDLSYPADLYLEGSDQHRGWFQSALITSMAAKGNAPYRKVLTHGFVVDGEGKKMSKSLGNVISPQDVMKKYGADILRLWVASSDYEGDIKLSDEILARLADGYRKIRNTFRYLLSNLYDFDPSKDAMETGDMKEIDRWILSRLGTLVENVTRHYDNWEFYKVYRAVYDFCVYEVSSFYLDVQKDIMYIMAPDSIERRSGQTAIFRVLKTLDVVMAPLLSFTSEEVWDHMNSGGADEGIHMADWPDTERETSLWKDFGLDDKWSRILDVRNRVMKILEVKREQDMIGSSLEAKLTMFSGDADLAGFLKENEDLLPGLFKVSQVDVVQGEEKDMEEAEGAPLKISVKPADGEKCPRCWNFSETVGQDKEFPELCERCYTVMSKRRTK